MAEERARLKACPLILGSATPSLESYFKAKAGEYKMIRLTKRIEERLLPKVKIVDMRMELATRKKIAMFSKILLDAIDKTIKSGKQAIIFLNRRGFSTFINCKKCVSNHLNELFIGSGDFQNISVVFNVDPKFP